MQTGNQTISFEIKSQLAKLLATENLSMRHDPSAKTAYFNVEKRELVLPIWQNISEDLYDMLVVHEVGHALDTPMDKWISAIENIASEHYTTPSDRNKAAIKGFLNVIEDARIDKRQKRRYPGSRRNFVNGYKELHEKDFFNISKRDINGMTFIDRANIFFKGGAILNIKFSEEELVFIKKMENTETFEDVVEVTSDIFAYSLKNKDVDKEKEEQLKSEISVVFDEYDSGEESDDVDYDDLDEDEDEDENDGKSEDALSSENDRPDSVKNDNTEANDLDVPDTVKAAEDSAKNIVMDDNYRYYYLQTPEIAHQEVVIDYKVFLSEMRVCFNKIDPVYRENSLREFQVWRQDEQRTISYMVKEFEMRKAADTYARSSIARTGVIDTNKIHSYKYNEDIFRRLSVVTEGKSHGFVMFIDWSGSMISDLNQTMKQLFSLVMFCKRIQVPFEVYLFRDSYDNHAIKDRATANIIFNNFKMRNILSSRMNTPTLNEAFQLLWAASQLSGFECDDMNGTPLNQTILAADYVVNKFRQETKVQIVNTIFLTDGGSDSVSFGNVKTASSWSGKMYAGSRYFICDHITKKNYFVGDHMHGHKITETFLKMLKERTNSNVIGFYITNSLKSVFGLLSISDPFVQKIKTTSWNQYNYAGFESAGYDEYYAIRVKRDEVSIDSLSINSKMRQNAVVKEFMKFSEKKSSNRVLLSSFIRRIAA